MLLGRLPHDPAAYAAAPRMPVSVPPGRLDRSSVDYRPGLYRNDVLPDCTAAGLANAAAAVAAVNRRPLAIDPARVPAFFAECVGCTPTDAAMKATEGARLLDVLHRQAAVGFDVGAPALLVGQFGTLPHTVAALAGSMQTFGHAILGVTLRERDVEGAAVVDAVPGRDDGNVVGGHCEVLWDFAGLADADTVRSATWGCLQLVTWRWVLARLDEAHAVIWRQLNQG